MNEPLGPEGPDFFFILLLGLLILTGLALVGFLTQ